MTDTITISIPAGFIDAGKAWRRGYRDAISASQIFDASECNGETEHKAYYAGHVAGSSDARAARYSKQAVGQSIASHNRAHRGRIGKRESALIHALLKGRG